MTIQELLPLLHQLNRGDKLRVLQFVTNELAAEEFPTFPPVEEFRLYTPYDSAEAAHQLYALLEDDKKTRHE